MQRIAFADGSAQTRVYDPVGRLTSLADPGGTLSYRCDALGRRTQATVNGATTTYLYDGLDVIAELGAKTAQYLRTDHIDEAIARYSSQADRYFLTDLLGSTQVLTDKQGNATTTYSYSPFGETEVQGQASDNPAQYTGREHDGTGLYYYRARYYAPGLARFISSDPIGLEGGLNTYAYVGGNPLALSDPLGLVAKTPNCNGPDCNVPYDPTPGGPKPSPQPKPDKDRPIRGTDCTKQPTPAACVTCCESIGGQLGTVGAIGGGCTEACLRKQGITMCPTPNQGTSSQGS